MEVWMYNLLLPFDEISIPKLRILAMEPVPFTTFEGVGGKSSALGVFAFPKFTISDAKELTIQVFEKNGDRNPALSVSGKKLLQADPILISNQKTVQP